MQSIPHSRFEITDFWPLTPYCGSGGSGGSGARWSTCAGSGTWGGSSRGVPPMGLKTVVMLRQANRKPDHAMCMGEGIVSPMRLLHLA